LNYLYTLLVIVAIPFSILLIRQPFYVVVAWSVVAPFFVVTNDFLTRTGYWGVHRAMLPVAAIVTLISCLVKRRLRFGWIDFFLLAYLLINIFSVLYHHPNNTRAELYHVYDWVLIGIALFWLIRTTAPDEAQLKRLMIAFIFLSLVQGAVGLLMNISPTLTPEAWVSASSERTTGTLGRAAEFSSTLMASMLLGAHYAFHSRKRLVRALSFLALLLGGTSLVLSFSRGSWLASAIAAILVLLLYPRLRPYILILVLILIPVLSTDIFADSIAFANERLGYQRTIDSRIISNYAHLRMFQAKPLLGWGFNNYTRYNLDFVKPVGGVAAVDVHISSHNTYLNMAVELGLIGLLAFLIPWLLLFKRSITTYKLLPKEGFYSRHLLILLWIGVIFWFTVTNFMNMRLAAWGMTWIQLLLGLIASVVDRGQELAPIEAEDQLDHRAPGA
jgi:O-antigen ligase